MFAGLSAGPFEISVIADVVMVRIVVRPDDVGSQVLTGPIRVHGDHLWPVACSSLIAEWPRSS